MLCFFKETTTYSVMHEWTGCLTSAPYSKRICSSCSKFVWNPKPHKDDGRFHKRLRGLPAGFWAGYVEVQEGQSESVREMLV